MHLVVGKAKMEFHDTGDSIYLTHNIILSKIIHDQLWRVSFALFKVIKAGFSLRFVTCTSSFFPILLHQFSLRHFDKYDFLLVIK